MDQPTDPPSPQEEPSQQEEAPINGEVPAEGAEEASSTASAKGSSGGSPFVAEPGPGFDPAAAPPGPEPGAGDGASLHALPNLDLEWDEDVVRTLLTAQGELTHGAIGLAEQDWCHTKADLAAIAPPLTRILNRYDQTRAAAAMGDPIALALGFSGYGIRSLRERRVILAAMAAQEDVPITGEPAPPGSGPPPQQQPHQGPQPPADNLDWQLPG